MDLKLVIAKNLPCRYPIFFAAVLGLWGVWLTLRKCGTPWYRRAAIALDYIGYARMIDEHDKPGSPYLHRHFIFGDDNSKGIKILIHKILKEDSDDPHDHPWPFLSFGLEGLYRELSQFCYYIRKAGRFYFRGARSFHRVEMVPERWNKPVWTLIITFPRMSKSWGFLTRMGNVVRWVHWNKWLYNNDEFYRAKLINKRTEDSYMLDKLKGLWDLVVGHVMSLWLDKKKDVVIGLALSLVLGCVLLVHAWPLWLHFVTTGCFAVGREVWLHSQKKVHVCDKTKPMAVMLGAVVAHAALRLMGWMF